MIRIVTSRRWHALTARTDKAEVELATTRDRVDATQAELTTTREELQEARTEVEHMRVAWGCAEAAFIEAGRQVEKLEAAAVTPQTVFILTRQGELHSAHRTAEAARARAAEEDASVDGSGWSPPKPGTALSRSAWRVSPVVVPGEEATS